MGKTRREPWHVTKYNIGSTVLFLHTWDTRGYARHVYTPWGIRTVELTGEPDTAFSRPARLQLSHNGKRYSIPGFTTVKQDGNGDTIGLQFHGDTSYVQELPRELLGMASQE